MVVVVEGQRFPAHRVVLAAGSQHFRAMFTRSFAESRADEVLLPALSRGPTADCPTYAAC